jgi:hypothetical protein
MGLFHIPGMGKDFGGELGKQAGEIVVLFAISPRRQFEHTLAADPQLLGIMLRCHFTRLIRHLIHLSKKLTLRRAVPDISAAKSFHDLESEFRAVSFAGRGACRALTKLKSHSAAELKSIK